MKSYGSYVKWLKRVHVSQHVVNVRTDSDYVRLSMVAHFCHEEGKKLKKCSEGSRRIHEESRGLF